MQLLREAYSCIKFIAKLSLNQPGLFAASNVTAPEYKRLPAQFLSEKLGGFAVLHSRFTLRQYLKRRRNVTPK